jgi:electron transport complex protein RnfD
VTAFAVWAFGLCAVLSLVTAVGTCAAAEHISCRLSSRPTTLRDGSVVITGLLYGLTLPPALPLWMVAAGGVIAVVLGKHAFGGLGQNPFNPALVGRAVLQAAFPVAMTTWTPVLAARRFVTLPASTLTWPFTAPVPAVDVMTGATPLAAWKFEQRASDTADLLLGFTAGSIGETSAVLILAGGAYLAARRMMSWRIPAGVFTAVVVLSGALHLADPAHHASPVFMLLSGGLMLGAVFMATDMVASPMTHAGCFVYGAFIGVLIVVIRTWGGMPEGVMYAILLGNAVSPLIDRVLRTRPYGTRAGDRTRAVTPTRGPA